MNKLQFWTLNLTSLALVILLVSHFSIVARNYRLSEELARGRAAINNARQYAAVLDQWARRIATGSETDPRLKNILAKYSLSVTMDVGGEKKTYP